MLSLNVIIRKISLAIFLLLGITFQSVSKRTFQADFLLFSCPRLKTERKRGKKDRARIITSS